RSIGPPRERLLQSPHERFQRSRKSTSKVLDTWLLTWRHLVFYQLLRRLMVKNLNVPFGRSRICAAVLEASDDEEQQEGADHTPDETRCVQISDSVVRHQALQNAPGERTCDAETRRHEKAHLLVSRHHGAGDEPDEKTEQDKE